ncbi:MAG TPA: Spy/CpxP family protein refolding chaperone [Thermoanaerobaculia bacterium]|nr:Spy/CpxP family protein refolding chaperone [Thermoanaerobaculia bacterium]
MKNRASITLAAVALVAVATIALAHPGSAPQRRMGGGEGHFMGLGPRIVAYLELTEAQKAQAKAIHDGARASIEPLMEQRRQTRWSIEDLLDGENPSASSIGELVITNRKIDDQVRVIRENARAQFVALLTPEQKAKYDEMMARQEERRERRLGGRGEGGGD